MMSFLTTGGPYLARNAEDLTQAMMDYFIMMGTEITDLSVGSVVRTEFEAFAQVIEQFYADQATTLQDAIQQSAYSVFNFIPATTEPATGYLVFTVDTVQYPSGLPSPLIFNRPTLWQPQGMSLTFATTVDFTIPADTLGRWHVPATCLILGNSGNLQGNVQGNLLYPQPGIIVTSEDGATLTTSDVVEPGDQPYSSYSTSFTTLPKGFIHGLDPESPLEMRSRFTTFLSSLHRSTPDALEYGALTTRILNPDGSIKELVADARTIDINNDPSSTIVPGEGYAYIFIYNGIGSPGGQTTTNALVVAASKVIEGHIESGVYIPGYRASGIDTRVYAADEYIVSLTVHVKPVGYLTPLAVSTPFLDTAVSQAVQDYFSSLKIGDVLYVSGLIQYIVAVPGVLSADITAMTVHPPTGGDTSDVADFTPSLKGIVVLGSSQPSISVLG